MHRLSAEALAETMNVECHEEFPLADVRVYLINYVGDLLKHQMYDIDAKARPDGAGYVILIGIKTKHCMSGEAIGNLMQWGAEKGLRLELPPRDTEIIGHEPHPDTKVVLMGVAKRLT